MDDFGRLLFEYLVITTAPSLAPHLDVVAIVFVVAALAVAVAVAVFGMLGAWPLGAASRVIPVAMRSRRARPTPLVRGNVQARAPSVAVFPRA